VLQLAAAAPVIKLARWLDAIAAWLDDFGHLGFSKAGRGFRDFGNDLFPWQNTGNKDDQLFVIPDAFSVDPQAFDR
jgi:hypothetical protein